MVLRTPACQWGGTTTSRMLLSASPFRESGIQQPELRPEPSACVDIGHGQVVATEVMGTLMDHQIIDPQANIG